MARKERLAKNAAHNMAKELDVEMTDEERERKAKSGMGIGGGVNKGEDSLFGEHRTAHRLPRATRRAVEAGVWQRRPCPAMRIQLERRARRRARAIRGSRGDAIWTLLAGHIQLPYSETPHPIPPHTCTSQDAVQVAFHLLLFISRSLSP